MADDRPMKRVLSGVQPSGKLHLGNYVGALTQWVEHQHSYESLFCVVDLHALTVPERVQPAALREKTREVAALYLAAGIDPERNTIFVQSDVRAHAELCWVLTCVTPLGWLSRMTQFKSKSESQETVGSGLMQYPVLQAADILVYQADLVPVGEDQRQHIELARDIAGRFNHLFGDTFRMPAPMIRRDGARIMGLDDPANKMSKSTGEQVDGHSIGLLDPPKKIQKAIMRAVTDAGCELRWDEASPGIRNLISIYQVMSGEDRDTIAARYEGRGYGYLKKDLAELVLGRLQPLQAEYARITADPAYLDGILAQGAEKAAAIADVTMAAVKEAVGLGR